MLQWFNTTTKSNLSDLKQLNNSQANSGIDIPMAEGFQFDNAFDVAEETGFALLDESSSHEEHA